MRLYHTSDREIINPDIHYGRKNADFGWGFYLTPDRDFTYRWARKDAVVNEYELLEDGLDIHTFVRDAKWFDYIYNNRRINDTLGADVIVGPIANDTIFDTLGILSSGLIRPENALKLLMVGPEYIQVAIKTEKAAVNLHFLGSEKIERIDNATLRAEQEAYQAAFAQKLEEITDKESL
ncbi:MAG: DUF3990 domain-containing protein [Lachnospiraceae bacterium]|nr:DUF3990 domain-containing protein [Lachnospiraceae bacterium]